MIDKSNNIKNIFLESIDLKQKCIENSIDILTRIANLICNCIKNQKKVMICGNGGSAADAQHLAAEMLIRLRPHVNRQSLPFISLPTDMSTITACGNDYSFDKIFDRVIQGLGNEGDCLLGISTSGNSLNIINAMKAARNKKIHVIGFLGSGGGEAKKYCDLAFNVPSNITGRIQEVHITAGHALMEAIEDQLLYEKILEKED